MEGFLVRDTTDRGELQVAKKAERTRDKKNSVQVKSKAASFHRNWQGQGHYQTAWQIGKASDCSETPDVRG